MGRVRRGLMGIAVVAAAVAAGPGRADAGVPYFAESAPASASYVGGTDVQPLVGDFTGDGRTDVFLYRPGSGAEALKVGRSDRTFATITSGVGVNGTYTPLVGDFDGNGWSDIFWYAPGKAADTLWLFSGAGQHTSLAKTVNGTYAPVVGDFATNGQSNGRDDIAWYSTTAGTLSMWRATATGHFQVLGTGSIGPGYRLIKGSFTPNEADGSTDPTLDLFAYRPGSTTDLLMHGDGAGSFESIEPYAVNGTYTPVVGLFDGYGVEDIFWYSPTGGDSVWLADPDTKHFTSHAASIGSGYVPIQGNFEIPDTPILWWSPSGADRMWFPQGAPGSWSSTESYDNTDMGAGYKPLTGDFDGDGRRDIYWLRPGTGSERLFWGQLIKQ